MKRSLKIAFLFLPVLAIFSAFSGESFGSVQASKSSRPHKRPQVYSQEIGPAVSPKTEEIRVQQIGPVSGEAPLDIGNVYNIVPPGKPLRASTQFKVVDDFNAGELKNSLGGAWVVEKEQEKRSGWNSKKRMPAAPGAGALCGRGSISRKKKKQLSEHRWND